MKHILFVDDEPRWVDPYMRELSEAGFDVHHESTVMAALHYLSSHEDQLSLLILDIMMPHGPVFTAEETRDGRRTGIALYKRVRKTARALPVILLTNVSDEVVKEYAQQEEHCLLVRKTESFPHELVDTINTFLTRENAQKGKSNGSP